jgi:hypothetical protein
MSTDLTVIAQRKATAKRDSDGDVATASIWLALYLLLGLGALFANQSGPVVLLVLFAAALAGWGVFGWRRKKKTALGASKIAPGSTISISSKWMMRSTTVRATSVGVPGR